jgi:hypothetical protein
VSVDGNMVVRGLYKNPVVAWREGVSNGCDAMRHSDVNVVKVFTNVKGDGIIENWGTGIERKAKKRTTENLRKRKRRPQNDVF